MVSLTLKYAVDSHYVLVFDMGEGRKQTSFNEVFYNKINKILTELLLGIPYSSF